METVGLIGALCTRTSAWPGGQTISSARRSRAPRPDEMLTQAEHLGYGQRDIAAVHNVLAQLSVQLV